ncbi:MAG: hypothetical protein KDD38_05400 [Bdellovibrionales bacterium]|nr:hypothetical protein [Bdellovibrionales bacterium]
MPVTAQSLCTSLISSRQDLNSSAAKHDTSAPSIKTRLRKLYENNESFRNFITNFSNITMKKLEFLSKHEDSERGDILRAMLSGNIEEFLDGLMSKREQRLVHVKAFTKKMLEMISYMDPKSEFPEILEFHFIRMVDLILQPYGKPPKYVKLPPDIYFKDRFIAFIEGWITVLSQEENVDLNEFISRKEFKQSFRNFVVYELIKEWDVRSWTVNDFD